MTAAVIVAKRSNATRKQPSNFSSLPKVFHCRTASAIVESAITPAVAATMSIKKCDLLSNHISCYLKSSCCGWMMSARFFLAAQRRRLVFFVPALFSRSLMMQVKAS